MRTFLPRYAQPDADAIENLSMAVVVDQKHLGGGSHSTVGTITDIYSVLRLLHSKPMKIKTKFGAKQVNLTFEGIVDKFSRKYIKHLSSSLSDVLYVFDEPSIGMHVKEKIPWKGAFRTPTGNLPIKHAMVNNLQNVSVDIPQGVLTVVTGVAGSGKSSLIHQTFQRQHPDAIVIDQSPVGISSRSNPATYTGIVDQVRKAFAKVNKVSPSLFSFNSKGACENCQGLGVVYFDLAYMDEVKVPCEVCGGKRFKDEVLSYKLHDKSIFDVLSMPVREALDFFDTHEVAKDVLRKLQALSDVGLDYLTLGQPLSTLSGGECQRIKLASELHKTASVYIMDEPTTGLHMSDIGHLMEVINRLVDAGNTVVIEHNAHVIKNADWIIDMRPEGGSKGVEVEPAYCDFAGRCARDLALSGVEFIHAVAREAAYAEGTVFFLYTPFEGSMLDQVLTRARHATRARGIRLFTYGPCTIQVSQHGWQERVDHHSSEPYRLAISKTAAIRGF